MSGLYLFVLISACAALTCGFTALGLWLIFCLRATDRPRLLGDDNGRPGPVPLPTFAEGAQIPQTGAQNPVWKVRALSSHTEGSGRHHRENPAAVNFWRALNATEQQAFVSVAHERTFARGATLMHEGEEANHVLVVRSGWTKICVQDQGRERVIAERGPGQLVGERGAFQVNVRSATVVALETVQALVMKTDDFAAFVSAHPAVLDIVEGQIYDRLTEDPSRPGRDGCRRVPGARLNDGRAVTGRPGNGLSAEHMRRHLRPLCGENCTVLLTDVVAFGARTRNDEDRRIIREAIFEMTQTALAGLWHECTWEDRGDGLLIVLPPAITTTDIMEHLLKALPHALKRHNRIYGDAIQIQLRVAVNVGPVVTDTMGMSGEAIILAARLLDAAILKQAIARSGATLGVITSTFVYETAIRNGRGPVDPAGYQRVKVNVKESHVSAWMQLIDKARNPRCANVDMKRRSQHDRR